MRLLAVSQRIDYYPNRNELRDALDQRLSQWVAYCGFTPVPIPNNLIDLTYKWFGNNGNFN